MHIGRSYRTGQEDSSVSTRRSSVLLFVLARPKMRRRLPAFDLARKKWTVRQNIFILSTNSAFCGLMKYEISVKIEIQSREDRADKSSTDFPDDPETAPLF